MVTVRRNDCYGFPVSKDLLLCASQITITLFTNGKVKVIAVSVCGCKGELLHWIDYLSEPLSILSGILAR